MCSCPIQQADTYTAYCTYDIQVIQIIQIIRNKNFREGYKRREKY